jgi:hypothetical protein
MRMCGQSRRSEKAAVQQGASPLASTELAILFSSYQSLNLLATFWKAFATFFACWCTCTTTFPMCSFTVSLAFLRPSVNPSIPVRTRAPRVLYFFSSAAIWNAILPESNAPAHSSSRSSQ